MKNGETPRSKIFFLGRENFPRWVESETESYQLGTAKVVFNNSADYSKSVTIAAAGPLLFQALKAAEKLAQDKIGSIVVNPSIINHVDRETFKSCLKQTEGLLLTAEDHQVVGGLGSVLTHALAQEGLVKKVKSLGVADQFGQSAYKASELYKKHGLDAEAMVNAAKQLLDA